MGPVRAHVDRKYVENLSNWFLMRYYKTVAVAAIETLGNFRFTTATKFEYDYRIIFSH